MFAPGTLEGRVALVTGGGTNLGKAAAAELVRCGASVLIAGRRPEVLERTARELGKTCSYAAGDIRQRDGAEGLIKAALDRHGQLDLLLNNAGGQYFVPAEAITAKGWKAVHRLNVTGTLTMCETAYELAMRPAGRGTIINVTVSPHHGMPAMAHGRRAGGRDGAPPAPGRGGGVRLAGRVTRHATRPRVLGFGDHTRRGPGQLDRPVAPA